MRATQATVCALFRIYSPARKLIAKDTKFHINPTGSFVIGGPVGDYGLTGRKIIDLVRAHFDLRPYAITRMLDLLHPMYQPTAAYGHFGRNPAEMTYNWDEYKGGKQSNEEHDIYLFRLGKNG